MIRHQLRQTSQTPSSPLPFKVASGFIDLLICDADDYEIAKVGLSVNADNPDDAEKNAAYLAHAANLYPELLAACKSALDWVSRFAEHAPNSFGGEPELAQLLADAINKSEGRS